MLTFKDIFKKSFLKGLEGVGEALDLKTVMTMFFVALLIGIYVFLIYRVLTRKTFYSRNFGLSLVGVALITTAIIVTIQGNVVVSLGMVGALSIVRFRTAIKDPIDLMFLFWSISVGIICGAGNALFAMLLSVLLTMAMFLLQHLPMGRCSMILIVNASDVLIEERIVEIIRGLQGYGKVKSRNITGNCCDLTIEVRIKDANKLVKQISVVPGISHVSLLEHDGEVTFG